MTNNYYAIFCKRICVSLWENKYLKLLKCTLLIVIIFTVATSSTAILIREDSFYKKHVFSRSYKMVIVQRCVSSPSSAFLNCVLDIRSLIWTLKSYKQLSHAFMMLRTIQGVKWSRKYTTTTLTNFMVTLTQQWSIYHLIWSSRTYNVMTFFISFHDIFHSLSQISTKTLIESKHRA